MSNPIVLSVNGRHGLEAASAANHLQQSQSLVRTTAITLHGTNGTDATPPVRGQPAGALVVELVESDNAPERITIKTLGQTPENSIPTQIEIPPQRNVILQAIGGDGEPGRRGGDGQFGRDGTPGADATKIAPAEAGSDGGDGGAAGNGTDGADGGRGGTIQIHVDEDKTHLLVAVDWEVKGGQGGPPGQHGTPGLGGKGGPGGQPLSWDEHTDYRYKCTQNCLGRNVGRPPQSTAVARRDNPNIAMLNGMTRTLANGTGLQGAIARIAVSHATPARGSGDLCICTGGNEHCLGCDAIPVFQKRNRTKGPDGADGQTGAAATAQLLPGSDGAAGRVSIIVRLKTGEQRTYDRKYQLELVDFDLEDENEDGIFEPGEHLFVRRIRVRNSGGMPSPARPARLEIVPSDSILPVANNEGRTFIPQIPGGQTVTLRGSIKAMIREPDDPILGGTPYRNMVTVALRAVMPGLNRRLEHFDFQSSANIQYPLELEGIDFIKTVAQGSQNKIMFKVQNKTTRLFGGGQISPRQAEIRLSIPSQVGSLLSKPGSWRDEIVQQVGQVKAGETVEYAQTSRISRTSQDHSQGHIQFDFYISNPGAVTAGQKNLLTHSRLTQRIRMNIQVSAVHESNEQASILVVTNCETTPSQLQAIRNFIETDLRLKMGVWNFSLYDGLEASNYERQDGEEEQRTRSILKEYQGKTVIVLANAFDFHGSRKKTLLDFCCSLDVANECLNGTSFLFLGASEQKGCAPWLKNAVFPVSHPVSNIANPALESVVFKDEESLLVSMCQQRIDGTPALEAYKVESPSKWYHGGSNTAVNWRAKRLQSYLKSSLPQERFWVCPVPPGRDPGYIGVWRGLPQNTMLLATEPRGLQDHLRRPNRLHPFDSYNIICSLPLELRLGILLSEETENESSETGSDSDKKGKDELSNQVFDALQFSMEEEVVAEIQMYLRSSPLINNINLNRAKPYHEFEIHFPRLLLVLKRLSSEPDRPPFRVLDILRYAIASTFPQNKRQVLRSVIAPFGQRRSHLYTYLKKRFFSILASKGYTESELKQFELSVKALHSRYDSNRRSMANVILGRNSKMTKCSTQQYQLGRQTTQRLVPKTEKCTAQEWDTRYKELKSESARIGKDLAAARKKRAGMSMLSL